MTDSPPPPSKRRLFDRLDSTEESFVAAALRTETVGGALLLVATVVALVWANSPWADAYTDLLDAHLGPLSVEHWATDGALTLFFFLAGVELKRELTVGSLSRPADALVPIVAAVCGMVVPSVIYVLVNLVAPTGHLSGWAVPMATDIAFALAVLAVVGRRLPSSLRAFLLTLAIVDDLGAITIIALFFGTGLSLPWLAAGLALVATHGLMQHRRITSPWLYVPIAVGAWWCVYQSGVHATVAGVLLGLLVRVRPDPGENVGPADRLEHRLRPISAGFAVPVFALFAAGVPINFDGGLLSPVVAGIVLGLVVGKAIGVTGGAWLTARFTRAELAPDLAWRDVAAVAVLAGIGFTVALLIAELSFPDELTDTAKIGVLAASIIAAGLATLLLQLRGRQRVNGQDSSA